MLSSHGMAYHVASIHRILLQNNCYNGTFRVGHGELECIFIGRDNFVSWVWPYVR